MLGQFKVPFYLTLFFLGSHWTGIDLSAEFVADGLQPLHVPGPRFSLESLEKLTLETSVDGLGG